MLTRSKSKQMRSKANPAKKSKGSKLRVSKSQKKKSASKKIASSRKSKKAQKGGFVRSGSVQQFVQSLFK